MARTVMYIQSVYVMWSYRRLAIINASVGIYCFICTLCELLDSSSTFEELCLLLWPAFPTFSISSSSPSDEDGEDETAGGLELGVFLTFTWPYDCISRNGLIWSPVGRSLNSTPLPSSESIPNSKGKDSVSE